MKKTKLSNNTNRKLFEQKEAGLIENSDENTAFDEQFIESKTSGDTKKALVKPSFYKRNEHLVNQSPSKEELKRQNMQLIEEMKLMKYTVCKEKKTGENTCTNILKACRNLLICQIESCGKEFITTVGLNRHFENYHSEINMNKKNEVCKYCGKEVYYIDKHIRAVHREALGDETCEICKKTIFGNIKKHRGMCNFCPTCGHENKKKHRLMKHIS